MSRMLTGKQVKMTLEEKEKFKEEKELERDLFESKNMGKYVMLYPMNEQIKNAIRIECLGKEIANSEQEAKHNSAVLNQSSVLSK